MDTKRILIVDDNPGMIQVIARILSGAGQLQFATSGASALQRARETPPDLILLDAEMPGMSGYDVCEALKADPGLAEVPVMFITAHSAPSFELKGLEIGAVDFLTKPFSEPLLLARVKTQLRVKHLTDELKRLSITDELTETVNRRGFDAALASEWKRCLRNGAPISVLMLDVDHFKLYNDHYGHPAGDACLRTIAQALKQTLLRPADVIARYGGEEFVMLLPQTPRAGAQHLAHRLLDAVEAAGIPHAASPTARHVTVSIGISCYDEHSTSWMPPSSESRFLPEFVCSATNLVQSADRALFAAKRAGRAQAWQLDVGDTNMPDPVPEIAPELRQRCQRSGA